MTVRSPLALASTFQLRKSAKLGVEGHEIRGQRHREAGAMTTRGVIIEDEVFCGPRVVTLKVSEPPKRKAGIKVKDVAELVDVLKAIEGVVFAGGVVLPEFYFCAED